MLIRPVAGVWGWHWATHIEFDADNNAIYVSRGHPGEARTKQNTAQPRGFCDLAIKPDDNQITIATSQKGIFRSTDNGIRGTKVFDQPLDIWFTRTAICFDPRQPTGAYVGVCKSAWDPDGIQCWFLRSQDAGATWIKLHTPVDGGMSRMAAISVQPTGEIYIATVGMRGYVFRPKP